MKNLDRIMVYSCISMYSRDVLCTARQLESRAAIRSNRNLTTSENSKKILKVILLLIDPFVIAVRIVVVDDPIAAAAVDVLRRSQFLETVEAVADTLVEACVD